MAKREDIKIVFMGTPEFAKSSLEKLYTSGYNVVACFTNPDKPSGRGMHLTMSHVKEYAVSKNIPVYQPVKLRNNEEVIKVLKDIYPDIIVVVAYGKILPEEILNIPRYGCVNVHGSLLPKYRGAAPIQWAIINGEKITGITTMFMDKGMDTGDMLLKEEVEILDSDNLETLYNRLKEVGANLLIKTLDGIVDGTIIREKQAEEGTIAPQITREMTKIDFNKSAREIVNFVRGIGPALGTFMVDSDGNIFKVFDVKASSVQSSGNIGEIVLINKKQLGIKCREGVIEILSIQAPNSKRMDIASFLAGNKIKGSEKFI